MNSLKFINNCKMKKRNIALVATLDTKGKEAHFVKKIIKDRGHNVLVLDPGLLGKPLFKAETGSFCF